MAKQVQTKNVKVRQGDVEQKGKKKGNCKKSNQGNSKNSKFTTKNRSKDKKGRK